MPRYFFGLRDDENVDDEEGCVLPDIESALVHARMEAQEMICACLAEGRHVDLEHRIEVRDENGDVAAVVQFAEATRFVRAGEPIYGRTREIDGKQPLAC